MKTKLPLAATAALLLATVAPGQTPATPAPDALPGNPAERGVSGTNTGPAAAGNGAALHQQSLESVKQKKFKEAAEFSEQATKADPTTPEYFSQLGVALSQRMTEVNFMQMAALSGRMKKAFEKSIELDPNHIPGLIGLTRFHTNAPEIAGGSLVKAAEFAARLQKINPYLGELELARIAEKAEKPDEAIAHYDAAAQANPKGAGALAAAGRLLAQVGKKDEARARFEAALKINPEHEVAKKGLAELEKPAS